MSSTDQTGWDAVSPLEDSEDGIFEKEEDEESDKHQVWVSKAQ